MEKVNEIRKVLDFYVKANDLKNTIIDKKNNYSIADHLYGCCILAAAIDSEFKQTKNIGKIIRMLILTEFNNVCSYYDYNKLNLGDQYYSELAEAKEMSSPDSKLVLDYKTLDFLLTELISKKSDKLSEEELIDEGSNIISLVLGKRPAQCREVFKFYKTNYKLKNKIRSGWDKTHWNIKTDRIETVSEHVIGTLGLLMVLSSEFEYDFDVDKELIMLVLHEIGEAIIGDITPFDGITEEEKEELERRAVIEVLGNLRENKKYLNLLDEFNERKTLEAKNAYLCDKIEADLQSKIYSDKGMHHELDDQENNCTFKSSKIQQMLEDGAKDAFDIWYEWDKGKFEGNKYFPEFSNILEVVKNNSLLHLGQVLKEQIRITDDERLFLAHKIVDIVQGLVKDNNINSGYMTGCQNGDGKGILNVVIVLNERVFLQPYRDLMKDINEKMASDNNTGIKIEFTPDFIFNYTAVNANPYKLRKAERLAESKVLFDKTGALTNASEEAKKGGHLYNLDLVEYVPPVEEGISYKLSIVE